MSERMRRWRKRLTLAVLVLWTGLAHPQAGAAERVAWVIGNAGYSALPAVEGARNDARQIAIALLGLGFAVTLRHDVSVSERDTLLADFRSATADADLALLYFSGHGFDVAGEHYLVPVDAALARGDWLALADLVDAAAGADARIVLLDTSRVNPFDWLFEGLLDIGLDPRPADASADYRNTLIGYATSTGAIAVTHPKNGLFTTALLALLSTPGLELRSLLTRVRERVVTQTEGFQWPTVTDNLAREVTLSRVDPLVQCDHRRSDI